MNTGQRRILNWVNVSKSCKFGATENEKSYNVGGEIMAATVKGPFENVIGLIYNTSFQLKD